MKKKINHKFIHKEPNTNIDPAANETIAFLIKGGNHEVGGYMFVKKDDKYFSRMKDLVREKHKCIDIWKNMK